MGRKVSPTTIKAMKMLEDGMPAARIADKLDISRQRVYQIKQRMKKAPAKAKPVPTDTVESFRFSPPKPHKPRTFWERLAAMF